MSIGDWAYWGQHSGGACKDSRISFSISVTLLPLSLNSLSFSLNRLGDDIGIPMIPKSVRVDSMVTKVVWVSVGVGKSRCLNFHLLYNRLNKGGGVNIWVVKTICQIVGISLSISLSIGLTLPPFGSLRSSSGSSGERESMSPETIVRISLSISLSI